MMLYLSSDNALPAVQPYEDSNISVQPIEDPLVARHFGLTNVYYVGSYQGCGCGFSYARGNDYAGLRPEVRELARFEDENRRRSVEGLLEYLRHNLVSTAAIELFSCWAGNETQGPCQTVELTIDEFAATEPFQLGDGTRYVLHAAK